MENVSQYISYNIVKELINMNIVGQDQKGNAIFKVLDENKNVVGAEKRGTVTGSIFKQVANGSKSGYGVNIVIGEPQKAFFFESAIDLIRGGAINIRLKI